MKRLLYGLVVAFLLVLPGLADDKDKKDQASDLTFVVVKSANGKPIRNASVILHPVSKEGKQAKGGLQLKTDGEGKAAYNSVPYGKLRIQVIARGFQTFGEDYEIDQPQKEIVIKMNPPKEQYSIYK